VTDSDTTRLALDAHGGDQGLTVSAPAIVAALAADQRLEFLVVGDCAKTEPALAQALDAVDRHARPGAAARIRFHHADSVIPMDAKPAAVLRRGRDSSLWKAFELVAEGSADG